ncbi:MAG: PIN domain-containing protein [Bacteroidales bacterium]|nr:PIN domain-containing protein [Bacteroidales bacterium]
MNKVLIDTDVILDFFFDRQPFSDDAAKVLSFCELNRIRGFVTPVIISNIYYILRQTAKHEKVIEKISQLLKIIDVLVIDKTIVLQALDSGFIDFEDALQNFAAEKAGDVGLIITRNIRDYKKSNLGVMTPADFLKLKDIEI